MTKAEKYEKAINKYFKAGEKTGLVTLQPSRDLSKIGWKYVHLNNINGALAKYVIKDGTLLMPDNKPLT